MTSTSVPAPKSPGNLDALLAQGVIPIVNENDSVSDEEIKFGDNDVLSALLCSLGKANLLVILSTAKGLMTHPQKLAPWFPLLPRSHLLSSKWPKARIVPPRWVVW